MNENSNILLKQIHDYNMEFREATNAQFRRLEDGQQDVLNRIELLAKVADVKALEARIKDLEEFKWKTIGIVSGCQMIITAVMIVVNNIIH